MNVFRRFTRASLAKNRSRTLVTVVGIMLSMALVTAVIQGAYSGVQFLVRTIENREGAFHAFYYDLSAEEAAQAQQQDFIRRSVAWRTVGWAEIGSDNAYKPYLLIRSVSEGFTDLVAVHLTAGRLPETAEELLLPEHLAYDGDVQYAVGDTLTLHVGKRVSGGYELNEYNPYEPDAGETLSETTPRTYTVVGTYQRLSNEVEDYGCPGYTALTGWEETGTGRQSVFFTVKNVSRFYRVMQEQTVSDNWSSHRELLMFYGTVRSGNITHVIYGFAAVLIFLIAFGSISLIYNSFAISVSERTRQFGILRSVGATKKQLRDSVLYEAVLLGGAGIAGGAAVGCAGIGITLWALRDAFALFTNGDSAVQMKLVVTLPGLLIAAAVCMLTTLISAWIPARRADRVSAVEAIRQTNDIRVRARDVKVSPLTKKLFGFEGMMAAKNFKRNRKRYRATVISLFLSVTLFIAASSFCAYLTDLVSDVTASDLGFDVGFYTSEAEEPDHLLTLMKNTQGVTQAGYANWTGWEMYVPSNAISGETVSGRMDDYAGNGQCTVYMQVAFVDDALFRQICDAGGWNADDFYDAAAPEALLYNRHVGVILDEEGERHWYDETVLDENRLPLEIYCAEVRDFDGYTLLEVDDDAGLYYYYPNGYAEELWAVDENARIDRSRAMVKTAEEAQERHYFTVAATVSEPVFLLSAAQPALLYPYAMREAVLGEWPDDSWRTVFGAATTNHAQVCEALRRSFAEEGLDERQLVDYAEEVEAQRMLVTVVRVFSYGFIILISLIAMANVFNTVSTNVMLRRRELAMLKSIGLGEKGFRKMMNYECIIYGSKGLLWGLPAAVALTWVIYRITVQALERGFYIPWYSVAIAVGSVFAVVFATMLYATRVIRRDNPIDALKQENL